MGVTGDAEAGGRAVSEVFDLQLATLRHVGYWEIGGPLGIRVALSRRPNWLHRTMVRLVFGFVWKDGPMP